MTGKAHLTLASLLAIGVAALALTATPALAVRGHVFGRSFDGKTAAAPFQRFERPAGVAVEEATGDVYVLDEAKDRVEWFNSAGTVFEGYFNGSETPAKVFSDPEGIAIDNTCALHEAQTGEALGKAACEALDPSNGDVYVADTGDRVVDKFSAAGIYLSRLTGTCPAPGGCKEAEIVPFEELDGISVDAAGELFVATSNHGGEGKAYSFNNHLANKFAGTASTSVEPGALQRPGFAVDARDDLYASFESPFEGEDFVSEWDSAGALSNPRLDSAPFAEPHAGVPLPGLAADLAGQDVYVDESTSVARFGPYGELLERFGAGDLSGAGGVAVNSSTGQVYVADSSAGVVAEFAPEPAGPPEILGESVAKMTSEGARLEAEASPHGASASYRFEYGRCASLAACPSSGYERSAPEPEGVVGSDFEAHRLGASVEGLLADTAYRYRVVAHNVIAGKTETVDGAEGTFVTQSAGGGAALPDAREWELVSPPDAHGARVLPSGLAQAAASGGAFSYLASAPIEAEPHGFTNGAQVLSARGEGGWSARDVAIAHETATGYAAGEGEYRLFSQDLSLAAVQPFGAFAPLSGEASEQTAYLRENASGLYTPLVTRANTPPGTVFGGETAGGCAEVGQIACGPKFRGATPDLSHIVLSSPVALSAGAPAGEDLYEWSAGAPLSAQLELVGAVEQAPGLAFHAISDDGSRVVFAGTSEGREGLLSRDTATGETVQLDAVGAGCTSGCAGGGGVFQGASNDGSRVFFTDEHRLSSDSGGTIEKGGKPEEDLYVCEVTGEMPACDLRDLTPLGASEEHAGVVGVLGASEDGSYVYFVANGILSGEELNGAGEHAVQGSCLPGSAPPAPGRCNLYAMHDGGSGWEAPRLLAVLSSADQPDWSPVLEKHTARVSPDGQWLAFMSQRSLTGYDNEDVSSQRPGEKLDEEVFLYRTGAGVVCASCNPTGERPAGVRYSQIDVADGGLAGGESVWPASTPIAASVPGWESYEPGAATYQPRYLSNGGRLFFDSSDQLVPRDVDGTEDVYEYEPAGFANAEGTQRCTAASAGFGERSDGCVDLISSGRSSEESAFLDASESGGDVFFLTSAKLVSQDTGSTAGVYDAHECTSASPCFPASMQQPPGCVTEASCKPAPGGQPAVFGAPESATFSGPPAGPGALAPVATDGVLAVKKTATTPAQKLAAALKACRKDRKQTARKQCEKTARARYGAKTGKTKKKPKQAGHNRKSGS